MRVREPTEGRRIMCQLLRVWTPGGEVGKIIG